MNIGFDEDPLIHYTCTEGKGLRNVLKAFNIVGFQIDGFFLGLSLIPMYSSHIMYIEILT